MYSNKTTNNLWRLCLGVAVIFCMTAPSASVAFEPVADVAVSPGLVPDDPNDIIAIPGPWTEQLFVRVVTVADGPQSDAAQSDPSRPTRTAFDITHVNGSIVHVNLVEVGQVTRTVNFGYRQRVVTEIAVNSELPFTVQAQLMAANQGFDIHQADDFSLPTQSTECWVTGQPILEIPVTFDPNRMNNVSYGLEFFTVPPGDFVPPPNPEDGDDGEDEDPRLPGGDPVGDPDPPADPHTFFNVEGALTPGGDPVGDPDPPGFDED
jgi:hypothetical protein